MLPIVLEQSMWVALHLIYCNYNPTFVYNYFKSMPFFERAKMRKGVIATDAQSDSVYCINLAIHHLLAGSIMLVGWALSMPQVWDRGYCMEVGYEVGEIVAMIARLYPYHNDSIKKELKYALAFHHCVGLVVPFFIFASDLHEYPHLQSIAAWMVLQAGAGACVVVYIHSLDFTKDMAKAAIMNNINVAFFLWTRYYVVPKEALALLDYLRANESIYSSSTHYVLYASAAALLLFNLAILGELSIKTYKYNKAAFF